MKKSFVSVSNAAIYPSTAELTNDAIRNMLIVKTNYRDHAPFLSYLHDKPRQKLSFIPAVYVQPMSL